MALNAEASLQHLCPLTRPLPALALFPGSPSQQCPLLQLPELLIAL